MGRSIRQMFHPLRKTSAAMHTSTTTTTNLVLPGNIWNCPKLSCQLVLHFIDLSVVNVQSTVSQQKKEGNCNSLLSYYIKPEVFSDTHTGHFSFSMNQWKWVWMYCSTRIWVSLSFCCCLPCYLFWTLIIDMIQAVKLKAIECIMKTLTPTQKKEKKTEGKNRSESRMFASRKSESWLASHPISRLLEMLSRWPRYLSHGPAALMWSVVHLPLTCSHSITSLMLSVHPVLTSHPHTPDMNEKQRPQLRRQDEATDIVKDDR